MPNVRELENALPVAPLKVLAMESAASLGARVNDYLVSFRKDMKSPKHQDPAFQGYIEDSYLLDAVCPRFGSGEAKGSIHESVHGKDVFIIVDVCNHSLTYSINGHINHKSPDDNYQDLKRMIAAAAGKARRINVIMPFLYEGRQHRRAARESLDCAYMLRELADMGVDNFITFDAHDPRVQNATPLNGFDNFTPPYQFIRALMDVEDDLLIDKDHTIVISPDEGALDRAVYFGNVLGVNTGMFYKRRDYSVVVNGKNPIVAHEFLGDNIDGKDVIIIDDMISSGESMLDTSRQLKEMNAKRVFICCTFGLFTNGLESFDKAYENCWFDRVITTNLTYQPPELYRRPYYTEADMSKFMASIIDFMNHDVSMSHVMTPTEKINAILAKYNRREEYHI
ncbi:MAG TPA: ribose-phosphate pyrophosphokinase [Candidatus Eisenbergiella merdipullorum]|uniref:ribose-phosphate diphosphokinase n=1 Tax=Candidatus Eisenbergiella merdipullorum TaxID=2838553 RepID=A0A9D2L1H4_9FIRM|nr:ribose-phosphate pyrophosphokinase [Candidatus Eisenbergiella merdipullorum]